MSAYERREVKLKEDLKHSASQLKKISASISKESKKESDCSAEAEAFQKQMSKDQTALIAAEARRVEEEEAVETIMSGLQEATLELRRGLEGPNERLIAAERVVSAIQTEKEKVCTELDLLLSRRDLAVKAKVSLEEKCAGLETESDALKENNSSLKLILRDKESESAVLTMQLDGMVKEESSVQQRLHEAVVRVEELKAVSSSTSKSGVVAAIMKATKKGGPLYNIGIRGRLGDLASIAPEYDVAISSSCSMLDSIVVDTASAGEKAIDFLRSSKQGRANFIALDQIGRSVEGMNRAIKVPENAPRLFDLISVKDEAVRPAFYLALKDTLVTSNLDVATSIAYEGSKVKWRVVTLDGKLIDMSGAMSGGGDVPKAGGMLLSNGSRKSASLGSDEVSAASIESSEVEVVSLQKKLQTLREAKASVEMEVSRLGTEVAELKAEMLRMKSSLSRLDQQLKDSRVKLNGASKDCVLTAEEASREVSLQKTIAKLENDMNTASPDLLGLRAQVAALQEQIKSVGGPRLKRAQNKLDQTSAQIDQLASGISRQEVELKSAHKNVEKAKESRETAEIQLVEIQKRIECFEMEKKGMEADAKALVEAVEATTLLLNQHDAIMEGFKEESSKLKRETMRMKEEDAKLAVSLGECKESIAKNKLVVGKISAQLVEVRRKFNEEQNEHFALLQHHRSMVAAFAKKDILEGEEAMDMAAPEELEVYDATYLQEIVGSYDGTKGKKKTVRDDLATGVNVLEEKVKLLKSTVNMSAVAEYMKRDADYRGRVVELEVATEERNAARKSYEGLRRQRLEDFMAGFGIISLKLKEMYQMITLGGDAELELVDSLDPFSGDLLSLPLN